MHATNTLPYQIYMSSDPMEDTVEIEIGLGGTHNTVGLITTMNKEMGNRTQLLDCLKSTPAARIPRWRSTLRNSFPISINGTKVKSTDDIIKLVKEARSSDQTSIICKFAIISKIAMHPQMGIPILYHDQLNVVAKHIADIKDNIAEQGITHQRYLQAILPSISAIKSAKKKAKLTRRILKVQTDWLDWEAAEHKQLQQYEDQGMFSDPVEVPPDANYLPFIWTYVLKDDGTKKARAPCNGSPRMQ